MQTEYHNHTIFSHNVYKNRGWVKTQLAAKKMSNRCIVWFVLVLHVCVDKCVDNFWKKLATWAIFHIIVKGEESLWEDRQRWACLCSKQTPRIPIIFPAAGLSHVYEWSCWLSRHSYRYSVCIVLVTYPLGARCRRWQRLARWCWSIIGKGSKSGAEILDNRHLEQNAKSLCAQDTTVSRRCILSVSAGHVVPLDILWKRMNRQASYFGYIKTLAYVNLGRVDRSPSTALVTTHLTLAL